VSGIRSRHAEIESKYGNLLERFVITTSQRAGLMRLPPAVIQAGIHYLAVAGKDPALVAEWNATSGVADAANVSTDIEAGGVRSTGRRSRRPGPGQVLVFVKIKKREGEKCNLRSLGFRWSGKDSHFGAIVDGSEVEGLRSRFPDCVTVDGKHNQIVGVLGGGTVDGAPLASGDPLTMPVPSPTNIEAAPTAGSDDPQSSAGESEPQAEPAETRSDVSDAVARSKSASKDIGLPQAAKVDPRPQTKPHGASPFSRLPTRPSPKGS
jgi:hypothetical protein